MNLMESVDIYNKSDDIYTAYTESAFIINEYINQTFYTEGILNVFVLAGKGIGKILNVIVKIVETVSHITTAVGVGVLTTAPKVSILGKALSKLFQMLKTVIRSWKILVGIVAAYYLYPIGKSIVSFIRNATDYMKSATKYNHKRLIDSKKNIIKTMHDGVVNGFDHIKHSTKEFVKHSNLDKVINIKSISSYLSDIKHLALIGVGAGASIALIIATIHMIKKTNDATKKIKSNPKEAVRELESIDNQFRKIVKKEKSKK